MDRKANGEASSSSSSELVENNSAVDPSTDNQAEATENNVEMLQLTVKLPGPPKSIRVAVSSQETINDIKQSILELPATYHFTCFSLWFNGEKLGELSEIQSIEGLRNGSELILESDAYTERESRSHVLRVRDHLGIKESPLGLISGYEAGISLFPHYEDLSKDKNALEDFTDKEKKQDLSTFLPPTPDSAKAGIKALGLSPWNPPPPQHALRGDLLYLQLMTLEGEVYHLTSHTSGFFVSNSTAHRFDPSPRTTPGKSSSSHSLMSLIFQISPLAKQEFGRSQDTALVKDPLLTFPPSNAFLATPWLANEPKPPVSDFGRPQEPCLKYGQDNVEGLRDWNEDIQTTWEMPSATIPERILRERLLHKLHFDFAQASVKGAVLIARGEVPALNPLEPDDAQIFMHNGIFFSYGSDGIGAFAKEGGDAAARVAVGKDLVGVRFIGQLDTLGLSSLATVVIDYLGRRIVAQSPVPGIFRQRDDGNNQVVYGGVDGHDKIADSEEFAPLMERVADAAHLKTHPVWDVDDTRYDLHTSVETKGLEGTDGRKYILDLYKLSPLDIEFLDAFGSGDDAYPHRLALLRLEAVDEWWKRHIRAYIKSEQERKSKESGNGGEKEESEDATNEIPVDISPKQFCINPDVFSVDVPKDASSDVLEQLKKEEQDVREISKFLNDELIPEYLSDIELGTATIPIDGTQLSKVLHQRGINLRYLGRLEELSRNRGPRFDAFRSVIRQEIITRSFKHVLNEYISKQPFNLIPYVIVHFMNCLLGSEFNDNPTITIDPLLKSLYKGADYSFMKMSPSHLRELVVRQALLRFRHPLEKDWEKSVKTIQLFREISLKLGLQWKQRKFAFDRSGSFEQPSDEQLVINQAKAKKTKAHSSSTPPKSEPAVTFTIDDLLTIIPVSKDSSPRSLLADEALETGRLSIIQGKEDLGKDLLLESLSLHEQIYGVVHPLVAQAYSKLAMIYNTLNDKDLAVSLGRKAVIIAERTMGVDSVETILMYLNLGLLEHSSGRPSHALAAIRHALSYWDIVFGEGHPDLVTTCNNVAVILQTAQDFAASQKWFERSLTMSEKIFGPDSLTVATINSQLAQALVLNNDSRGAVSRMREAYDLFLAKLGPDHKKTKDADVWLKQLTANAVNMAKQAKDLQTRNLRRLQMTSKMSMDTQPVNSATNSAGLNTTETQKEVKQKLENIGNKSIDELLKYIEGSDNVPVAAPKKKAHTHRRKNHKK